MSEEIVASESYSPSGDIATVEPIEEETLEIGEEDGLLLGDDDEEENRRGGTVDPVSRFVDGNEEGEITIPYEYPTGIIHIDQFDMLPMMNAYEQWTATPGMTGEPLDSFTLLLKFEGMGAQDLTVGLAHKQGGKGKGMYQLIIGNKGNLQVDLEKRRGKGGKTVASAAGLLCASNKAHRYWIAVKNGRIDFGVGDSCGQHTVLSYQDPEDPIEVRFVGFTCLRHRTLFRNITMEAVTGGPMGDLVETNLEFIRAEGCDEGFSGEDKAALDSALELYRRECENMKRRARKFGGAYKPPFLQDWVPWTLVKRLSWNRDLEGGIDRESKEERQKRKLRAERFGVGGGSVEVAAEAVRSKAPLAGSVDPDTAELMTEEKRFARSQKFSIPDQMWRIQAEEQDLQPADIFIQDLDRADPEPMATTFPHKIHIFSFDKAVCKQIRDNDVKAYFEGFGPKYVEWLSDWSFNVVFEDAEEAKNAAGAKSFGLPEVLPRELAEAIGEEAVVDMGSMGWRLGVPMCKIMEDRHGPKGQWVRLLLRCAEEQDILLERPKTPLKPQGPIPRRLTGKNKLPPAVRAAQGLSSGENEGSGKRRPGIGDDGGNGNRVRRGGGGGGVKKKRSRGDGRDAGDARDVILGQALKSSRTSNRRKQKPRETKGLEDRAEAGMTEIESGGAPLVGLSVPLSLGEDADGLDA